MVTSDSFPRRVFLALMVLALLSLLLISLLVDDHGPDTAGLDTLGPKSELAEQETSTRGDRSQKSEPGPIPKQDSPEVAPPKSAASRQRSTEPAVASENAVAIVRGFVFYSDGTAPAGDRIFLWGGKQPGNIVAPDGSFEILSTEPWQETYIYLEHAGTQVALAASVPVVLGEEQGRERSPA